MTIVPAIITASVALIAAVSAQFLSHCLNDLREKRKRMNDIYQEFIYPFIPEVLLYCNTETNLKKGHDVEKEVDLNDLLKRISGKVSYGNIKLLSCYYQIKKTDHFFDGRGGSKERNMLRFMFWYLDYAVEILEQKKPAEEKILSEIVQVQKLYGIWVLVAEEIEFDLSIEFMKYDFYLSKYFISQIEMSSLRNLVANEKSSNYIKAKFLKEIIQELERNKEGDTIPGLEELNSLIELGYYETL